MWRELASCVHRRMSNLGLDAALFLIDSKFVNFNGLSLFYKNVYKSAILDISHEAIQDLKAALLRSRTLLLKQVDCLGSGPPGRYKGILGCGGGGKLLQRSLFWPGTTEGLNLTQTTPF